MLPLHKVASGGELARIALALKSVFRTDNHKTLVFDEIDVGISGDIALKVAEKNLSSFQDKSSILYYSFTTNGKYCKTALSLI